MYMLYNSLVVVYHDTARILPENNERHASLILNNGRYYTYSCQNNGRYYSYSWYSNVYQPTFLGGALLLDGDCKGWDAAATTLHAKIDIFFDKTGLKGQRLWKKR